MLTEQKIALLTLRGREYHRQLVRDLITKEAGGDVQYNDTWAKPIIIWQAVDSLNFSLLNADYNSMDTILAYDQLTKCVGANVLSGLSTDPHAQLPGGNIININGGTSGGGGGAVVNSAIIPFNADVVQLLNYQANYKPTYGNDAVISIWTLNENGIGYSEDTGTVPSKQFVDNDPTKDLLNVTWTYPKATVGYIQILGVITSGGSGGGGGNTPAQLPITNLGNDALSDGDLNGLYPFAKVGQLILMPNVPLQYLKLDNSPTGDWEQQIYTSNE